MLLYALFSYGATSLRIKAYASVRYAYKGNCMYIIKQIRQLICKTTAVSVFTLLLIAGIADLAFAQELVKHKSDNDFYIGLIPERNIFEQMERYETFAAYLSKKTGMNIKLRVLTRYGNIIDNFIELGLDGAFFGSFTYALAHAKLGVEPIARPESLEGVSTYFGMIFVRKDSNISAIKDLKGKIFAFVDKSTTAGHLLPLAFFNENGIEDYSTFFDETYFAGTHEDVINDVLNKRADIGAAKNTVFFDMTLKNRNITDDLLILKRSPEVPSNGLAVRKDLDESLKKKLKSIILNIHNDPEGKSALEKLRARKFIETNDEDYKGVYDYINSINLDLGTYDYMNE